MQKQTIVRGDRVLARTATNKKLERVATSGVVMGEDFLVVFVAKPDEYERATSEGREPESFAWPADAVELAPA